MPPSPSFRRCPSFERGVASKGQDHDLALFNDMQSREEDSFLLQPADDFDDIFSLKVKPFPELRLGINIPTRGRSNDLLNVEAGKNDYDWLLTPPETPLFPSLDDEPTPANLIHNSRARSRPISISRSSTKEKRSSRGSPSPQRLSPSPQSGTSIFRGRPSSVPHTTAANVPSRPSTQSRRPSPPPDKPSSPPTRNSTPPPILTSGLRGTSPVRTNRGNSASPKVRSWQSNISGFSLEVPPNLRASLADRPATYVRGSSPASRASNSSSKFHSQSISPTASRSIGSSHSQERDRFSSQSKGSVLSSGDDEANSLQLIHVSERPMSRRGVDGFSNNKPLAFSKKSTKKFSSNSAPKRFFDSAVRHLDRKIPQNMFRPLLSSVSSSTFYAGKNSVGHHPMISRNSSVITRGNASSDQATCGTRDTEGSCLYQDDMPSESVRAPFSDVQSEVFSIDEMDVASEDIGLEAHATLSNAQHNEPDKTCVFASITCDSEESDVNLRPTSSTATSEAMRMQGDFLVIDSHENTLLCSMCGCQYHTEITESEHYICPQCKQKRELLITHNSSIPLARIGELSKSDPNLVVPWNSAEAPLIEGDMLETQVLASPPLRSSSDNTLTVPIGDETILDEESRTVHLNASCASNSLIEMHRSVDKSDSNIDMTEGQGIAVLLLKRSSSLRGPLIHGRTFSSSSISYDELLNTRDLTSSMRSSGGHCSTSTSYSIDLVSARHGEVVQRQLSGRRADTNSQHQSSVSSISGTSMQISQGFGVSTSSLEESREIPVKNMQQIVAKETHELPSGQVPALVSEEASRTKDVSVVMVSCTSMESIEFDNFRASIDIHDSHVLHEIGNDSEMKSGGGQNVDENVFLQSAQAEESTMSDNQVGEFEVEHDPQCALPAMSEIELDDSHPSSPRSQSHIDLVSSADLEDSSTTMQLNTDAKGLSLDPRDSENDDGVVDKPIVTVEEEEQGERKTRSLTLEEATDAILFCSSIVHGLAYKAATIGIDKEKENLEPLQVSRPTITIPEKRNSKRRDLRGPTDRKKIQKARKTSAETEPKSPLTKHEEKSNELVVRNIRVPNSGDSMMHPKLESKCNCTIM